MIKKIELGNTGIYVPNIAVGCMRIPGQTEKETEEFITSALDSGLNFFDHADIYGGGVCEEKFGKAVKSLRLDRESITVQTKCGIVPGKMFDFSKEHIIESAENSLRRLGTDYIDVLLLHRPDALVEPEEVAEAFTYLHDRGMVKNFGVSNQKPYQIELLKKAIPYELCANQMQFGLGHSFMVSSGMCANMDDKFSLEREGGILDYSRLHGMTLQAWSPLLYGFFAGNILTDEKFAPLRVKMAEIAKKYSISLSAVAFAWILRHPAKMQVVSGTSRADRIRELALASDVRLTREEWYTLHLSAGNILP